jgi:hypothetical protein
MPISFVRRAMAKDKTPCYREETAALIFIMILSRQLLESAQKY